MFILTSCICSKISRFCVRMKCVSFHGVFFCNALVLPKEASHAYFKTHFLVVSHYPRRSVRMESLKQCDEESSIITRCKLHLFGFLFVALLVNSQQVSTHYVANAKHEYENKRRDKQQDEPYKNENTPWKRTFRDYYDRHFFSWKFSFYLQLPAKHLCSERCWKAADHKFTSTNSSLFSYARISSFFMSHISLFCLKVEISYYKQDISAKTKTNNYCVY